MRSTKRTVIIRSLWAVVFLGVALAPYAAVFLGSPEATFLSVFVTPIFLVASEIASIRAITAGTRITSDRKRRILVWSLNVFGSAVAALIILLGSYLIASMPYCTGQLTAASCVQNVGLPAYFCIGAFAAASILGLIVAPIFALSDAARTGAWVWFAGILLLPLGSWAAAGSLLVPLGMSALKTLSLQDWLPIARLALPLLTPIITIFYSLTDREWPKAV